MVLYLRARQDWSGLWAERAWWGAGSFMQVKELMEEETTGQGNIRE